MTQAVKDYKDNSNSWRRGRSFNSKILRIRVRFESSSFYDRKAGGYDRKNPKSKPARKDWAKSKAKSRAKSSAGSAKTGESPGVTHCIPIICFTPEHCRVEDGSSWPDIHYIIRPSR